jgi:NTP pyrophosphatase (non-canonical NTP hydrolase)
LKSLDNSLAKRQALLELYGNLLREETEETVKAIRETNRKEIVDGALDAIWIATMILNIEGVDLDEGIQVVYDSNMSKLSEEKVETDTRTSEETYVNGKTKWIVRRIEDGKIMKPSSFVEPDVRKLL